MAIKYATRNDQYAKFRKEDIAVGLDLTLTACLMLVLLTSERAVKLVTVNHTLTESLKKNPMDIPLVTSLQSQAQRLSGQMATAGWLVAFMFLGLWSISTVIRKWGWKSETEMNPGIGIAFPLVFGILSLIGVMAGAAK